LTKFNSYKTKNALVIDSFRLTHGVEPEMQIDLALERLQLKIEIKLAIKDFVVPK